ncbi:hypothetical protein ACR3K2_02760 [Cryptosporidium serpentis]
MDNNEVKLIEHEGEVDLFCLNERRHLPASKLSTNEWISEINTTLQYKLSSCWMILVCVDPLTDVFKNAENESTEILFEILSSILYYGELQPSLVAEFLENSAVLAYMKIMKALGASFSDSDSIDISSLPLDSLNKKVLETTTNFNNCSPNDISELDEFLSFDDFAANYLTPKIMDTIWLLQMGFNDKEISRRSIWTDFIQRLERGNIVSRVHNISNIPKLIKLICIKDIVAYLDLGRTDSMGITHSMISTKDRLQQKYVRERTRLCFTVNSYTTQRECLKGYSTLIISVKTLFDSYLAKEVEQSIEQSFEMGEITTNSLYIDLDMNIILSIISEYDLSIHRSIGIIFEVFIAFTSSDLNIRTSKDYKSICRILGKLLNLFPTEIVKKSFIIFTEYIPKIKSKLEEISEFFSNNFELKTDKTNSNSNLKENNLTNKEPNKGDLTFPCIGEDKVLYQPWLLYSQGTIEFPNFEFFLLCAYLVKNKWIEFDVDLKQLVDSWDQMTWNEYSKGSVDTKEDYDNNKNFVDEYTIYIEEFNLEDRSNISFFSIKTLWNLRNLYKLYQNLYNEETKLKTEDCKVSNYVDNISLKLVKNILLGKSKHSSIEVPEQAINFAKISEALSKHLILPSLSLMSAFVYIYQASTGEDTSLLISPLYETEKALNTPPHILAISELYELASFPPCIADYVCDSFSKAMGTVLEATKTKISNCLPSQVPELYKQFVYNLIPWIDKYCQYYLFKRHCKCLKLVLEILNSFLKYKNQLDDHFQISGDMQVNYIDPLKLLLELSLSIIFPSVSYLPRNRCIPNLIGYIYLDNVSIPERYQMYQNLINVNYNSYPMSLKWKETKNGLSKPLKRVTQDILEEKKYTGSNLSNISKAGLSSNSYSNWKRLSLSTRLLISNIVSYSYTNPLVMCDIVLNQCYIYDNMIPLLVEIVAKQIDTFCLDIMVYSIVCFILKRPTSLLNNSSKKILENNLKISNSGIAHFGAHLFKKRVIPKEVLVNFIYTLLYRIDETLNHPLYPHELYNNFMDIFFWEQMLEVLLNIPKFDLSVLTTKQVNALAGGRLLFQQLLRDYDYFEYLDTDYSILCAIPNNNLQSTNLLAKIKDIKASETLITKKTESELKNTPKYTNVSEISNCEVYRGSFNSTGEALISIFSENSAMSKELLYRIAKLRLEALWDVPTCKFDVKLITQISDEIHWCCIQLIEFLTTSFSSEVYRYRVLNLENDIFSIKNTISEIFRYLDSPIAWFFLRHGLFCDKNGDTKESTNIEDIIGDDTEISSSSSLIPFDKILDTEPTIVNCLREYISEGNLLLSISLLDINMTDFYLSFWLLGLSDLFIPKAEYFSVLTELHNNIMDCYLNIEKIGRQNQSLIASNHFSKFPVTFFTEPKDIPCIPALQPLPTSSISRQLRDTRKQFENKYKQLSVQYYRLAIEFEEIFRRRTKAIEWLDKLVLPKLRSLFNTKVVALCLESRSEICVCNFEKFVFWICESLIIPRVTQSESDALFCFYWIQKILLDDQLGLFGSNIKHTGLFFSTLTKIVGYCVRSSSAREAQLVGLFTKFVFQYLSDNIIIESEHNTKSSTSEELKLYSSEECFEKKGIFELSLIQECELNILASLSLGLGILSESRNIKPDWIDTRGCVWILLHCSDSFPVSYKTGNYLLKIIPNIIQYSTEKQWNDLTLSITSLNLKLKQRTNFWIRSSTDIDVNSTIENEDTDNEKPNTLNSSSQNLSNTDTASKTTSEDSRNVKRNSDKNSSVAINNRDSSPYHSDSKRARYSSIPGNSKSYTYSSYSRDSYRRS